MKITYTMVNGRKYAYTCTSKRVSGKKNPVSKRTYLGVVDPITGRIIPKKGGSEADSIFDSGFTIKSWGDVLLVHSTMERTKLIDDILCVFGDKGWSILAVVMAMAIRPSSIDEMGSTFANTCIRECLGLKKIESSRIIRSVKSLQGEDIESFFRRRCRYASGSLYVIPISVSMTDRMSEPLRGMYSSRRDDDFSVVAIISESGELVGFRLIEDPMHDRSELMGLLFQLGASGRRHILIPSSILAQRLDLSELITHGLDFIIRYPRYSGNQDSMESEFDTLFSDDEYLREDGTRIMGTVAGIMLDGGSYRCIGKRDPMFENCGARLTAMVAFDPSENSGAIESANRIIHYTKDMLNGRTSDDPELELATTARGLAHVLRVSTDGSGAMKVTVRRDRMSELRRNAGRSLIITTVSDVEAVLHARSIRLDVLRSLEQLYRGSNWAMRYGSRSVAIMNQMFLEFLVAIVYHEIQEVLKRNGMDVSVQDALYEVSSVKVINSPAGNLKSSVNRRADKILKVFGIDVSTIPVPDSNVSTEGRMSAL